MMNNNNLNSFIKTLEDYGVKIIKNVSGKK